MRSTIEATLILTLSVFLTLFLTWLIFPSHALGGGAPAFQTSPIEPAVFVYGTHDVPGAKQPPSAPGASDRTTADECPYLASRATTETCPAMPEQGATTACPFLLKKQQPELEAQNLPPVENLGQHT